MTNTEFEILNVLMEWGQPLKCSTIGAQVFGGKKRFPKKPQCYARIAGKFLWKLFDKNLVIRENHLRFGSYWRITAVGKSEFERQKIERKL